MSCPGCLEEGKRLLAQWEVVIAQAKEYAKQKNIPTAVYKEAGEYKFCDAFLAFQNGYPVMQVVSVN